MKFFLVEFFVFMGHCCLAQSTLEAHFFNSDLIYEVRNVLELVQPEDFADFINGIDPRYDTHVMMMRVNYEKEMFTKKDSDGNPDSSDIQQLLQVKTRFEAAATVLFRVSDEYIPEYIDSMRKCWSGSQRLVLIKQEVPLPKPYPMNHIYYYKGLEGMKEMDLLDHDHDALVLHIEAISADPLLPTIQPIPDSNDTRHILVVLVVDVGRDVLFKEERKYIQSYLSYLSSSNNGVFVILANAMSPSYAQFIIDLQSLPGVHVVETTLQPYQTFPITIEYNGESMAIQSFLMA